MSAIGFVNGKLGYLFFYVNTYLLFNLNTLMKIKMFKTATKTHTSMIFSMLAFTGH